MKVLLIFLFCFLQSDSNSDCETFYKKELIFQNIKGKVIDKQLKNKLYVITVKQNSGETLIFQLLPNGVGHRIYAFITKDSFIMKKKGTCSLHILSPKGGGSLTGQIFDNLCDE